MALTFPLSLTDFANGLQIESINFRLRHRVESSGVGTGMMIVAQNGPDFWAADVKLRPLYHRDSRAVQALIDSLDGGINDFYLYDPVCAYPLKDPGGVIIGASAITNTSVNSDGIHMGMTGFPVGYVVSPGDMFDFDYGPGNAYRALHRVVAGDTANGSGNVSLEFRPRLDDVTIATGKSMDFTRANARMKIINESIEDGTRQDIFTSGISFTAEQVP